jgi:TatD DNase family protein
MISLPEAEEYIDIHNHGSRPVSGVFSVEVLMAHEERVPVSCPGMAYTYGIHPWYLDESNHNKLIASVIKLTADPAVIAVGECGYDKLKGPPMELQRKTFEEQIIISEEIRKPLVIHCVRAWDELLASYKKIKPGMPWLIHGFRGKPELAIQLISKGMYLSFWFDFIVRPEAAGLIRQLPGDRIFLETDGANVNIADIYNKVSADLGFSVDELKRRILLNFVTFFKIAPLCSL